MTLPASGAISLSQIKAEFGGPNNLTAYYRGGTYVANTAANAAVPTSGAIKLKDFYGASAFTPVTRTYTTGTTTDTVPTGATSVRIGLWVSGDGGDAGDGFGGGVGGNGGSYSESLYSCSGGKTINYSVDAGGFHGIYSSGTGSAGAGSVSSGTLTITTMNGNGGNVSNTLGNAGGIPSGTVGGTGGAGLSRTVGGVTYAGNSGGNGGSRFTNGVDGARGQVVFYYT